MTGTIVSFTLMAVAGRAASLDHDTFEIMLFRSVVGIVIVVLIASALGTLRQINTRSMGLHLGRNVFHFTGQNLWFYALTVIPLAQVFALEFTMPLWVMLLAPIFLGERMTGAKALSAAIGFVGILVVTRPGMVTISAGTIAGALAAIAFAVTAIYTKRLTRTQPITVILFWLTVIQAILGLICAGYDGDIAWPTADALPWLIVIALAGLTAHFCLTMALTHAPATVVTPIDFVRLPVIAVVGVLLYEEPLEAAVLVGAVLIFGANWLNLRAEATKG